MLSEKSIVINIKRQYQAESLKNRAKYLWHDDSEEFNGDRSRVTVAECEPREKIIPGCFGGRAEASGAGRS